MSLLVAYDHSIFTFQEQGGISRYFVELASHLQAEPELQSRIIAPVHVCQQLREQKTLLKTGVYVPKIKNTFRIRQWINNSLSGYIMQQLQPDIIHSTYYLGSYRTPRSCKKIVTVFDMIHEKFPENMDPFEQTIPDIKKRVIDEADHVICISEQTRNDVLELLGIEKEKTSVVHLASSFSGEGSIQSLAEEAPYFLYVGSRAWPKNFDFFIEAFASLRLEYPDIKLVCFGGGEFNQEELGLFSRFQLQENSISLLSGDDKILKRLYANALALVYPSLYEGFGLPLLEAMACGCPVACSNTSSLPEVAGEAAVYFSPTVVDEITQAMQSIVESPATRSDLITRGYERAALFSWKKCARETAEVYRSCLQM